MTAVVKAHWRPRGARRLRAPGGESGCRGKDPVWSPPACSPAPPFLPDTGPTSRERGAPFPSRATLQAALQPGREQGAGRGAAGRLPGSLPWALRPGLCGSGLPGPGNGRLDGPRGDPLWPESPRGSTPQSPTVDPVSPLLGPLAPGASAWRGHRQTIWSESVLSGPSIRKSATARSRQLWPRPVHLCAVAVLSQRGHGPRRRLCLGPRGLPCAHAYPWLQYHGHAPHDRAASEHPRRESALQAAGLAPGPDAPCPAPCLPRAPGQRRATCWCSPRGVPLEARLAVPQCEARFSGSQPRTPNPPGETTAGGPEERRLPPCKVWSRDCCPCGATSTPGGTCWDPPPRPGPSLSPFHGCDVRLRG